MVEDALRRLAANTLRTLAMDGVQKANSGHPGMPMGMADVATVLFTKFLKFSPKSPGWFDRDRFVLSAGHGSMLLYGLLHLTGYDLPLDELKAFRQWGSRTPGPPRARADAGRRDDDRAAGAGDLDRRRPRPRRADARGPLQPPGARGRRPPHVRHRERRRHDGGDLARVVLARRAPGTGEARRPVRRQPHLDRRPDVALLLRGRPGPLRRLRLARAARRRARRGRGRGRDRRREGRDGEALARRLPDPHRLRQPEPAGHERRPTASRSASTR